MTKYSTPELLQIGAVPEIVLANGASLPEGDTCLPPLSVLDID